MLGAIAGDMIGSVYEAAPIKHKNFPLFTPGCTFTDDSVLTVAVADCLLHGKNYVTAFHDYFHLHPRAGFGGSFSFWASQRRTQPYGSWGNGAAMRVSPIGWAFSTQADVLREAERNAAVTHDHPEGIRGAQATALAVFLARTGHDKSAIRDTITAVCDYDLQRELDDIRSAYRFDVSCQGSVPESLLCFFESVDYEDAVRNAVSLGGDADTMACIAGSVAEAYYGDLPQHIAEPVLAALTEDLRSVVAAFGRRYCVGTSRR